MAHTPQDDEALRLAQGDCIGGFPYAELNCRGCGKPLSIDNAWMTDGCPCNTPLGVNSMNETRWRLLMMLQQREARYTESLERAGDALKAAGDKLLVENTALLAEKERLQGEIADVRQRNATLAVQLRDENMKRSMPPSALLARAEAAEMTPRTDKAEFEILSSLQSGTEKVVKAEVCRAIEIELRQESIIRAALQVRLTEAESELRVRTENYDYQRQRADHHEAEAERLRRELEQARKALQHYIRLSNGPTNWAVNCDHEQAIAAAEKWSG